MTVTDDKDVNTTSTADPADAATASIAPAKPLKAFSAIRLSIGSASPSSSDPPDSLQDNAEAFDQELLKEMSESLTFEGAERLSRAIPLARVMRGCGSILAAPRGTLATFEKSVHAQRIKYFISHNWSMSRADKFLALALTFNFNTLAFVMLFLLVLIAVVSMLGLAPEIGTRSDSDLDVGFLARTTVVPVTLLVVFFGRDVLAIFGPLGPLTFLDKACIHQVDESLKIQGIGKLGAFLRISDRMLILYGEAYYRKLWTVYEVANFLTFNNVSNLDVVPVLLPRIVFGAIGTLFLNALVTMFLRNCCDVHWTMYVVVFCSAVTYATFSRRWALHKLETQNRLRSFEVRDCVCTVESDRKIIYWKIAGLMRIARRVERHASLDECLTAFNEMVRARMPAAFKMMFGPNMLSYPHSLIVGSVLSAPTAVDELARFQYDPEETVKGFCRDLFWCITGYPLAFWCTEVIVAHFPHWRGCKQALFLMATVLGLMIPAVVVDYGMDILEHRSDHWALWAMISITSASSLLTILVVCRVQRRAAEHQAENSCQPSMRGTVVQEPLEEAACKDDSTPRDTFEHICRAEV